MSTRTAFTVRLPDELYRSMRVYGAENGTDLQDVAAAALTAYLKGEKPHAPNCPLCDATSEEKTDARLALAIIRKGSESAKVAFRSMLRALAK